MQRLKNLLSKTSFIGIFVVASFLGQAQSLIQKELQSIPLLTGGTLPSLAGKTILLTNIAFNGPHAAQLQDLKVFAAEVRELDVIVIAIPTNDFGNLNGKTDSLHLLFEDNAYNNLFITQPFQLTGEQVSLPVKPLVEANFVSGLRFHVRADFQKFIFNSEGQLIAIFGSRVPYSSEPIRKAIMK
jgi:glutathione peroxidase-family protein